MTLIEKGFHIYEAANRLIEKTGGKLEFDQALRIFENVQLQDIRRACIGIDETLGNIWEEGALVSAKDQLKNIDITLSDTLGSYKTGAALDALVKIAETMQEEDAEEENK